MLHELAREVDDESQEPEIDAAVASITKRLDQLDLRSLFTGEHDEADCIVQINAKDGGVDAQDWAEILLRMYGRWAERRGFGFELDEYQRRRRGRHHVGRVHHHRPLRVRPDDGRARHAPAGAHQPVRQPGSPPDQLRRGAGVAGDGRRSTSRSTTSDIRMEVFRASGAGGQHVNKTSSAVRLIHEPTGLVAQSQEERSQLQNREKAMSRLKTMIAAKIEEEHEAELDSIAGQQAQVGWGSQIRSYVRAAVPDGEGPAYRGRDRATSTAVLDGDLDEFMEGYLAVATARSE